MNEPLRKITVESFVPLPCQRVWELFTSPEHIVHWNFASPDWHAPDAENDLRPGGNFVFRMAARDGSFSFDFTGTYFEVTVNQSYSYRMPDGREVTVSFETENKGTRVREVFDPETVHPPERQREGWQAILDNFCAYATRVG